MKNPVNLKSIVVVSQLKEGKQSIAVSPATRKYYWGGGGGGGGGDKDREGAFCEFVNSLVHFQARKLEVYGWASLLLIRRKVWRKLKAHEKSSC